MVDGFFSNKKTVRCSTMTEAFAKTAGKYPYCEKGDHPCTSARHPAAVHIRILNERSLDFWETSRSNLVRENGPVLGFHSH